MSSGDDERRKRLSVLCKRLRGNESLRSFTKTRSQELKGISHASWSAWESERAGLSADSLDRLASFIGCSHQSLFAYLDGSITLEELLQPNSTNDIKVEDDLDFSHDTAAAWIKSLKPQEQLFIVSQGFQAFQEKLNDLVEQKAKELVEQETQQLIGEKFKLLINLLSSDNYPQKSEIAKVADKLNLKTEDLMQLCSRIYSNTKEYGHSN
ncbi:MAG: hypothetical protein AAFW70_02095 [Cyanobacteria bacterium J06635_10]